MKKSNQISPIEENEIIELFSRKKWEIDEVNKMSLFNRFMNRYQSLDVGEARETFMLLAEEYILIKADDYVKMIIDILSDIFVDNSRSDVLICPLLNSDNDGRIKSSTFLSYLFNSVDLSFQDNLCKKKFTIVDNHEMLSKKISNEKILLLIDDYIGSGNQAILGINDIFDKIESNDKLSINGISKIYILALCINKKGIISIENRIKKYENVELIYGRISESRALSYEKILRAIDISDGDKTVLGYKDCGDLITMIRTPNNTIPLFKSGNRKAIFPR